MKVSVIVFYENAINQFSSFLSISLVWNRPLFPEDMSGKNDFIYTFNLSKIAYISFKGGGEENG